VGTPALPRLAFLVYLACEWVVPFAFLQRTR